MSFVASTISGDPGHAVRLSAIVEIGIESASQYIISARLLDGSAVSLESYATLGNAQTALARWLDALGQVTV